MLHCVIGTLVDAGELDPEQPWRPGTRVGESRVTRATRFASPIFLAMRDGLGFNEVYELGQTSDVVEMLFGEGKEDMAGYTAQIPLAHPPDTVFNYSSGTTNVLSRIVADRVGYGDAYRDYHPAPAL